MPVDDDFNKIQTETLDSLFDHTVRKELPKPYVVNRPDPWIISCESWLSQGQYIALPLNPESIAFSMPLRVAHDDGYACKYIYIWRRRRTNSMTGSMQISFTLSSGNILPQFDLSTDQKLKLAQQYTGLTPFSEEQAGDHTKSIPEYTLASVKGLYDTAVPIGVSNLYSLLALANTARVRNDGVVKATSMGADNVKIKQQTENRLVVCISTLVFPKLLLYGQFTPDGIQFSVNADNPAEFSVTFSMLVSKTSPSLGHDSWRDLIESYKQNMYVPMRSVEWMMSQTGYKGAKPEVPPTGPTETYQETIERSGVDEVPDTPIDDNVMTS
jgi:hypothetical protein